MSIINSIYSTIVAGDIFGSPMNIAGNALECTSENKMVQTTAQILQSSIPAVLATATVVNVAESFRSNWKYFEIMNYAAYGVGALVLSIPLMFVLAKNLSPENKEKIENFQKSYATAIKIINIITSAIALWLMAPLFFSVGVFSPVLLSSAGSLISSVYTLQRSK